MNRFHSSIDPRNQSHSRALLLASYDKENSGLSKESSLLRVESNPDSNKDKASPFKNQTSFMGSLQRIEVNPPSTNPESPFKAIPPLPLGIINPNLALPDGLSRKNSNFHSSNNTGSGDINIRELGSNKSSQGNVQNQVFTSNDPLSLEMNKKQDSTTSLNIPVQNWPKKLPPQAVPNINRSHSSRHLSTSKPIDEQEINLNFKDEKPLTESGLDRKESQPPTSPSESREEALSLLSEESLPDLVYSSKEKPLSSLQGSEHGCLNTLNTAEVVQLDHTEKVQSSPIQITHPVIMASSAAVTPTKKRESMYRYEKLNLELSSNTSELKSHTVSHNNFQPDPRTVKMSSIECTPEIHQTSKHLDYYLESNQSPLQTENSNQVLDTAQESQRNVLQSADQQEESLFDANDHLRQENIALKIRVSQLKETFFEENELLKAKLSELQGINSVKDNQMLSFHKENQNLQSTISSLNDQLEFFEKECQSQNTKEKTLEEKVRLLQSQLEKTTSTLAELQQQYREVVDNKPRISRNTSPSKEIYIDDRNCKLF